MLELILNKTSPKAIILRDLDSILCTGAIVAQEFFPEECCDGGNGDRSTSFVPEVYVVGDFNYGLLENVNSVSFHYNDSDGDNEFNPSNGGIDKNTVEIREEGRDGEHVNNNSNSKSKVSIRTANLLQQQDSVFENIDNGTETGLQLTVEEQRILKGEGQDHASSKAMTLAMRTIVRVTSISLPSSTSPSFQPSSSNQKGKKNTTRLIPITSAHIDAVTFIGNGGLRFVEELVQLGGKVSVKTTLNSQSVDRRRWKDLGVEPSFANKANRIGDAYLKLGCQLSFTCAPYLIKSSRPSFGEQIMWGESNAVVYANSVIGARTEKYADYFDICAALIGKVPLAGFHLSENRIPSIVLDATELIAESLSLLQGDINSGMRKDVDSFYPTMGWLCGQLSDGKVPLILGFDQISSRVTDDDLKAFCAAFGTTGTSPLFHMAGITPEAYDDTAVDEMLMNHDKKDGKVVKVTPTHLIDAYETLNSGGSNNQGTSSDETGTSVEKIDLIALGNPHLSVSELRRLTELVKQDERKKHGDVRVMAALSRHVHSQGKKLGYIKSLEDFGITFVNDTCWCMMIDQPIIPASAEAKIMTNSGKYAHYGAGLTNRSLRFASLVECIDVSKNGTRLLNRNENDSCLPSWLRKFNVRTFVSAVKKLK
mmetsp:Transcript_1348/g.1964  ORF Transcript_1348/g.1964 Transcript_1348/m.1964 type:complete len:652 (-) Transcript_1348:189-2144(-)